MLPLLAFPTSVKYRDLGMLQKAAWDSKVKDAEFLRDVRRMKALEEEMQKLASELTEREPAAGLEMVRENDYELLRTWAVERVFLAVRPKGTPFDGPETLIPLEFDPDTNLMGINLKNDPTFERIDVGIEGNCFDYEANYYQELSECYNAEFLWENFDGAVRVVYRFPDGTLFTLYSQHWEDPSPEPYPIPLDTDYETYERENDDLYYEDDRPYPPQLAIYRKYRPDEVWIHLNKKVRDLRSNDEVQYTGPGSEDSNYDQWHWEPSTSPKRPLMSPVFAMDTRKIRRRVEGESIEIDYWSNIGLFYYAIEADVLMSIVEEFERVNGGKEKFGKRGRRES